MKLLCLFAILSMAVLDNAPSDAKVLKKRANAGPASWTSAENRAKSLVDESNNGDQLDGPVSAFLVAAKAKSLNIPNLLDTIFDFVEVAINSEDYYYYAPISSGLIDLFCSINELANDAITNAPVDTLRIDAEKVVNAAQIISCTGQCGTFSAVYPVVQLMEDMKKNSTIAILNDVFFLPQAAIASFSLNSATPVVGPTISLLRDINTLLNVCISKNSNGLSSALQAVLSDAENIGDSMA